MILNSTSKMIAAPRSTSLITTIPATQFSRAERKCFAPFQFGTRPFDALFKLDAK
jgi:hypothetical protein